MYVVKRLFWACTTVLIISAVTFFLMHTIPGDPFMSEKITEETRSMLKEKYGLDEPVWVQYQKYMKNMLHGDFGVSFVLEKNRPISDILWRSFWISAKTGIWALLTAVISGIIFGSIAGFSKDSYLDKCIRFFSTLGISVPSYVIASYLMLLFSVKWNILPPTGIDEIKGYVMPVSVLALQPACYFIRLTRGSIVEVLQQDYMRTVNAKGLSMVRGRFFHALKNSCVPIITYLGPLSASILTGGFVVENIFHIPGLGRYFVSAISSRDYALIMALTIFFSTLMIGMNLICDLSYQIIDPRIRLEK